MRILFFNYEYPPLGGGAANATANILREYAKIPDLEVDLVTSSIDQKYHLGHIGENVNIHRLPIGKKVDNLHLQSTKDLLMYPWRAYWFSRRLIKIAKKEQRPYGLTHSFFTVPCGFISMLLKWEFRLPYIVSLRGSDVPGYSDRWPLIYAFLKPVFALIWQQAAAVISNSLGLKELALKTNPKQKIGVIYNGVDTEKFKPGGRSLASVPEAKLLEEFNVVSTSRLTDRKGINYLIDAMAIIVKKYPQVRLKIIGDGNARIKFERQSEELGIKDKVKFLGLFSHDEMPVFYNGMRIFVLPSLNEGMSNTVLEAMSSGLPILATDTGGTAELVTDGENGYIIRMKDAVHLAEKMEILINNPALRQSMGRVSRERAEKLNWGNVAGEYCELYDSVILKT